MMMRRTTDACSPGCHGSSLLWICLLLALFSSLTSAYLLSPTPSSTRLSRPPLKALSKSEMEQTARDMTGYSLWCKFTGLDVVDSTFAMELTPKFAVKFSRGLSSAAGQSGFWRVVKYEDGRETIECTHPVPPEYMYFYDIEEPNILWRGELDFDTGRVTKGECITNKKRFGVIPYTVTLATWEADLLSPKDVLPDVPLPKLSEQLFVPPDDFVSPLDMERYPQYFSEKFRRWFFAVEEALAKGEEPPPRPQPFFVPSVSGSSSESGDASDGDASVRGKSLAQRDKGTKKEGKGF